MSKFHILCGAALLGASFLVTSCENKEDEKPALGGSYVSATECLSYNSAVPFCIVELPDDLKPQVESSGDVPFCNLELTPDDPKPQVESFQTAGDVEPVIEPSPSYIRYNIDPASGEGVIECSAHKHCNATSVYSTVKVNGNEIIINIVDPTEGEDECYCSYESKCKVWGAEAKKYVVTVLTNGQYPVQYEIDLSQKTSGELYHGNF